jgi:hypothetical protein
MGIDEKSERKANELMEEAYKADIPVIETELQDPAQILEKKPLSKLTDNQ